MQKNIRHMGLIPGREDPLKEGMATHFRVLAWRIPWTEEPGGLQSVGLQRVGHSCTHEPKEMVCLLKEQVQKHKGLGTF